MHQSHKKLYSWKRGTVFPRIVSAETILFWKWNMWKFSYTYLVSILMAIFYFILAAETIEGEKYSRNYGMHVLKTITWCENLQFAPLVWMMEVQVLMVGEDPVPPPPSLGVLRQGAVILGLFQIMVLPVLSFVPDSDVTTWNNEKITPIKNK